MTTIGLMLRGRCPADGGRVGPGAGDGVAVHVGLTRGCSVAAVFGCASVVLLVAGQDLVLDELDDVRQGELFPANPAGQCVSSHQFGIGCKQRKKKNLLNLHSCNWIVKGSNLTFINSTNFVLLLSFEREREVTN